MFAQFYAHMPWTDLPVFALLLFFSVFLAVVARMLTRKQRAELESLARLPLERDDVPGARPGKERP
jgi:cbb3-type cytochrome oxidase subunit 3